jgi:V/A-type H+-transporting ATPase subunit C
MNPYIAYEALNTKLMTQKGRLLDEDSFEKIMGCSTVEQVTEVLFTRYDLKRYVENVKMHDLHRDDLETLLNRYKVSVLENILHYCSGPYRDFILVFLMEYEIYDITLILRKIARGEQLDDIESHFIHSEKYSVVQYAKLKASRTVLQFIENLKGTPYYNPLKTVTDTDAVRREFHIEMKLQQLYYGTLLAKAEKLSAEDKRIADDLIGLKIDFLNVQWIYRAKKLYDISPEQMLIYSLQGGRRLGFDRLRKLCYSRAVDEMKTLARQFLKYDILTSDKGVDIERNADHYMFGFIKDIKSKGTIGSVLAYIYTLDGAVREFITVTEGIRYKLPREQLKQYLIHSDGN